MKQWVEPESTKPWKETFGNQSESKLTTRDVGLDKEETKEETEEALILTSLGVHSESTQPSECMGVRGLLANFFASEAFTMDLAGASLAFPREAFTAQGLAFGQAVAMCPP